MTKRTEEEDASHWYMCEEHLRINKSLTVKFPFALFISLNVRRHFSTRFLGTNQSGPEVEHRLISGETIQLDVVKIVRVRFDGN